MYVCVVHILSVKMCVEAMLLYTDDGIRRSGVCTSASIDGVTLLQQYDNQRKCSFGWFAARVRSARFHLSFGVCASLALFMPLMP